VLLFLLLEFASRLIIRKGKYFVFVPGRRTTAEPDPEILPSLEKLIRVNMNELGERGDPVPKGLDTKVLLGGGSSVECLFIDQETSIDGRLRKALPALPCFDGKKVHVGNIGKSLIDIKTLTMMVEKVSLNYDKIDVLVFQIGASDVVRWLENGAPANGKLGMKRIDDVFIFHPEIEFAFDSNNLGIRKLLGRARVKKTQHYAKTGRRYKEMRKMRKEAKNTIEAVPDPDQFLKSVREALSDLLKVASAPGRMVIVARQPWFDKEEFSEEELSFFWHGGLGNTFREQVDTFYSPYVIAKLMRKLDEEVAKVCEETSTPHINCKSLIPDDLEHYYDQIHPTSKGCAIIAEAVAEEIEKNYSES